MERNQGFTAKMSGVTEVERGKYTMIHFEETELRLGLPGGCNESDGDLVGKSIVSNGKRGFSETVDLKLNLSSEESRKDVAEIEKMKDKSAKPPAK